MVDIYADAVCEQRVPQNRRLRQRHELDNVNLLVYRDSLPPLIGQVQKLTIYTVVVPERPPRSNNFGMDLTSDTVVEPRRPPGITNSLWLISCNELTPVRGWDVENTYVVQKLRTYIINYLEVYAKNDGQWHMAALLWYSGCEKR